MAKGRWRRVTKKKLKHVDELTPSEQKRVERFAAMLIRLRESDKKEKRRKTTRRARKWPSKPGRR